MMTRSTLLTLLATAYLVGGIVIIHRRRPWADKMAKRIEKSWWIDWVRWTRMDYSSEYFRLQYLASGIFFIAVAMLIFLSVALGGKNHDPNSVGSYILPALVISLFTSGFLYIMYVSYRFGNKKR